MRSMKLLVAAAVFAIALPMSAASADVWSKTDPTEDVENGIGDISKIRVDNGHDRLRLRTKFYEGYAEGDVYFYLDTVRRNRGPEFRVKVYLDEFTRRGALPRNVISVHRVERFGRESIGRRACPRRSGWISRTDNVNVTVPRACLKIGGRAPKAVRLSVSVFRVYGGPDFNGDWDDAPRRHTFGPWVARG